MQHKQVEHIALNQSLIMARHLQFQSGPLIGFHRIMYLLAVFRNGDSDDVRLQLA